MYVVGVGLVKVYNEKWSRSVMSNSLRPREL